ncbi:MAG: hypothetical protein ISS66_03140 [Desulfobacteraceae bacterium]|nr:hypothetical protein [Desulfobacteraceae bacterium]
MKKISVWVIVVLFATPLAFFQGCAAEKVSIKIEKSLPQSKLAHYNDSFDNLREDLWQKAGLVNEEQLSNFKFADISIENGQLKIVTKTGSFSKGSLASKYTLRGDFDIQVDCHIDFLKRKYDMRQQLGLRVLETGKEMKDLDWIAIVARKREGSLESEIISACQRWGKLNTGSRYRISDFHGTFRIVRIGNKISTLFQKDGEIAWRKDFTTSFTKNDVIFGFAIQNFSPGITSITATSSFVGKFDNFRINAAQEIIEEEI